MNSSKVLPIIDKLKNVCRPKLDEIRVKQTKDIKFAGKFVKKN